MGRGEPRIKFTTVMDDPRASGEEPPRGMRNATVGVPRSSARFVRDDLNVTRSGAFGPFGDDLPPV